MFSVDTQSDRVIVTVTHPNGGTSEVIVALYDGELDVSVNTSGSNTYTVNVDGSDVLTS